jgi:hypothetical protein
MRNVIFILSVLGIAGFGAVLIPPVFDALMAFFQPFVAANHDPVPFLHSVLFQTGFSGLIFSVLALLAALNRLEKPLAVLNEKLAKHYSLIKWPLLLAPLLYRIIIVAVFAVNVPAWDDWRIVYGVMPKIVQGNLDFFSLVAALCVSVHLPIASDFLCALLGVFCKLNIPLMLMAGALINNILYLCIALYINTNNNTLSSQNKTVRLFVTAALGFVCNHIAQKNTILLLEGAFNMNFTMTFSVLAFFFFLKTQQSVDKSRLIYTVLSVLCGICGAFGYSFGVFVFPAILSVLILLNITKEERTHKQIIVYIVACVLLAVVYYAILQLSAYISENEKFNPYFSLVYFFIVVGYILGNPILAPFAGSALIAGGICTIVYLVKNKRIAAHIFPLCMVFSGAFYCGTLALARSGASLGILFSTHYMSGALFIFYGIVLIVFKEFFDQNPCPQAVKKSFSSFMVKDALCVVLAFFVLSNAVLFQVIECREDRLKQQALIRDYKNHTAEDFTTVFTGVGKPIDRIDAIATLEKYGWSFFAEKNK